MKLFRKIYLQVLLGILVLAMGILGYLLWEVQRQNLLDTCEFEKDNILYSISYCVERIGREEFDINHKIVSNTVVIQEFRNVFGVKGALSKDGKELYNRSSYEFQQDKLKKMRKASGTGKTELFVSKPQNVDGKKLILFYMEEVQFGGSIYSFVIYKDVTDIYGRTQRLFFRGMLFAICMLLTMGILLFGGIHRILQPLTVLKTVAAQIAEGEYKSRIQVTGKDEIAEVTISFNRMAAKVEAHIEALTEVNEKQKQLLGSLAHELKTPLTAIIGNADMLLTVHLSEQKTEEAIGYILSEGRRLARLSEKMLKLNDLENKEIGQMKKVKVGELLYKLEQLTLFQRQEKKICLELQCMPENLQKFMDEDLMMSLLINLLDNAVKASKTDSRILVRADEHGIMVEDFGKGIPACEIKHVTEAFYMVDKSRSKSAGGVGLGLALCEKIAELHGGRLDIESQEGKGTRVSVFW
ncbi:MAG: HAMP domain-containing histidine kinase [Lachnospiraceae bacterium]|nr:HAMP domain-containing histidine kinase [Lachnospiraceae bacterium]